MGNLNHTFYQKRAYMKSFKQYIKEELSTNPVNVDVYHGSGKKFDKFDQRQARIPNDHMGGGIAYFTDNKDVAGTYAKSMAKTQKTKTPHVYHSTLSMNNVFDVDHEFSGDKLKHVLPDDEREHENFARGAGLLKLGGPDKYSVLSKLRSGQTKLTGAQVFKGLSRGNVDTAKARDHLISKGYDGIRYNGGENMDMATRHNVYMPYNADSIKINKVSAI
jgi:hypothetical protein